MSASTWGTVATATVLGGVIIVSGVLSGLRRLQHAVAAAGIDPDPDAASAHSAGRDQHVGAVYFGRPWDVPALDGATQAPTPIGQQCATCTDPIAAGDRGWLRPAMRSECGRTVAEVIVQHRECELLAIVGHDFGVCDCTGFDTSRGSALELWRRIHNHPPAETENDHG